MAANRTWVDELRSRIFQKEVTVYDSYGYRDLADQDTWIVPMRVWVHDDVDTPLVEEALEGWAIGYFEQDLARNLEPEEKARLRECLSKFIADDKRNESVHFTFAYDATGTRFQFNERTTDNGVIAESIRVPDALVRACYASQARGSRWLEIEARTDDGHGVGSGSIRFLEPEGLSVISDIDDTVKVTHVPAGKKTVLRNTFLKEFQVAEGMRERYLQWVAEAGNDADTCFHYVSGSPWQLYGPLSRFLFENEGFPAGTVHMKSLRKNLLDRGAVRDIMAFALGGDLATLDQKVRQITNLMIHLPRRKFILVGDSGERDPEVYRAIRKLFPDQVLRIYIRDVRGERLSGMEVITGADVSVALDTRELEEEMEGLIAKARADAPTSPVL
ncbi:MAG TPA: phosphatase domain-containing protein [Gemmatimonas sp.]|nr:phosphatase domain-containing protein [Gemmatimonas sp.]